MSKLNKLRKKYMDNLPGGYSKKEIENMPDKDLLDMDYFLNEFDEDGPTIRFKCKTCKIEEAIPADIVMTLDYLDNGDRSVPPRFTCEKCGGIMYPTEHLNINGNEYTT